MPNPRLIDVHTGLSDKQFDLDRDEVLSRSRESLELIVDNAVAQPDGNHFRSKELSEQHDDIFFMSGIHPHDAEQMPPESAVRSELKDLYRHPKCVAVGECGLDYHYMNSPKKHQIEAFEWHLPLCEEFDLPLVVHTRDAEEDTMKILKDFKGRGMIHCFTASQSLADFVLEKGFFLCFSGIATFKRAEDIREVFLRTPMDRILIETDAPYLAPIPKRGERNEPSFLEHTGRFLADLRSVSFEEFALQLRKNSFQFFSRLQSKT